MKARARGKTKMVISIVAIIAVIAVIIIAFIILLGIYEGGFFLFAPSYNKMDRYLKANINELSYVADVLSRLDYDSIETRKNPLREEDKYNMKVSKDKIYETLSIPDELVGYIEPLYESGVEVIAYDRESIDFTMWGIMSESRGIAYSLDGIKPNVGNTIEVRQLSKENWYYYVSNFEKWKARNPHLFP
jgi:hypothetical protein